MRETGSILCRNSLWDCFRGAIISLLAAIRLRRDWVLGCIHTMTDSFCAGPKTIRNRASVNT